MATVLHSSCQALNQVAGILCAHAAATAFATLKGNALAIKRPEYAPVCVIAAAP